MIGLDNRKGAKRFKGSKKQVLTDSKKRMMHDNGYGHLLTGRESVRDEKQGKR
jgi:hypothetical protein